MAKISTSSTDGHAAAASADPEEISSLLYVVHRNSKETGDQLAAGDGEPGRQEEETDVIDGRSILPILRYYWATSVEYTSTLAPNRGLLPGPITPDDDPKDPIIIRRYDLGRPLDLTTAIPRESVLQFFYPHARGVDGRCKNEAQLSKLQMRRDIFLLAFAKVQSLPPTDKWSFFQIAGIHGLPHVPYDGALGRWDPSVSGWWGGYCEHGSPLFPTWHRPYVMLLEQSIIRQAKLLCKALSDVTERTAVADLADQLRIPFWDWADYTSRILGLPDVFSTTQISLLFPWKSIARRAIPNPLKSFVLPDSIGTPFASSDVFNPAARPNYQVPDDATPFNPLGYPTVRHVSPNYSTQNNKLNVTLLRNAETLLLEGVHALFHHNDWLSFSNHYWSPDQSEAKREYGHYSSLELVHDMVHDTVGGSGGHMSYPEIAGFDPIFFFHHANVDRLLALWQYCYPAVWIPDDPTLQPDANGTFTRKPNSGVDALSPLTPFRRATDEYVCSNDVRTVDQDCGYSYPEILRARKERWPPARMLYYMRHLYEPSVHFIHRWFLVLERIDKDAFHGSYSIRIFIDLASADANTPTTSPHYAGFIFVFARDNSATDIRCANCEVRPFMRASLELTSTMLRLGITTAPEMTGDDQEDIIVNPDVSPLQGEGAVKLVYVNQKGGGLPDPSISPKLTVEYEKGIPSEELNALLLDTARVSATSEFLTKQNAIPTILHQNHDLPRNPVHAFPLNY